MKCIFLDYISSFKAKNIFNFKGTTSIQTFKSILGFEFLFYLILLGVISFLTVNFIYSLFLPIMICVYNIQFYALIARTLNSKFPTKTRRNIVLSLVTLLLTLLSIASLIVYFYFIYDNPGINLVNYDGVALVLMIGMCLTPLNLIIRMFLVAAVYV